MIEVEVVAGKGPDEIGPAPAQAGIERIRPLDVTLLEVIVVNGNRDIEPAV